MGESGYRKEEDVNRIAETAISTFGRFDTWVNNAAVSIFGHAMDVTVDDMKRMFDTNFWGPVYGTRATVKHYTSRGVPGALINVGSLFGDRGTVIQSAYASAKFALHGWTESIRMELEKNRHPSRLRSFIRAELTRLTTNTRALPRQTAGSLPLYDLPAGSGRRSHPVCRRTPEA